MAAFASQVVFQINLLLWKWDLHGVHCVSHCLTFFKIALSCFCRHPMLNSIDIKHTVEPALSGHPWGISDRLKQGGCLIQVARNTVQRIWSPVLIISDVWPQIETFISSFLMICENKQGNQLLYLVCYIIWKCMNKSLTPCDRWIQVKTIAKVLLGLRKWWPWPLNRGDCFIEVQITGYQGK